MTWAYIGWYLISTVTKITDNCMNQKIKILHLEDTSTDAELIERELKLCAMSTADIKYYLDKGVEVIEESGFTTTPGLDYEFLRKKIDLMLANTSKEDLEEWLKMDKNRMKDAE